MINYLEFTSDRISSLDNNNVIDDMSEYMVILCNTTNTKDIVSKEFESDSVKYDNDSDEESEIEHACEYEPTSVYVVDHKQRIIITVENPYILTCSKPNQVWFAQEDIENKVEIFPITAFMGWEDDWNGGIWAIYRNVLFGRYGNFTQYTRGKHDRYREIS